MSDEKRILNVDEMTDYVVEKLRREGISVPRDLVARIFDIESDFMFEKGITDDFGPGLG